jgi:hypothetical protein
MNLTLLAYVIGSIALACGAGLVALALLNMEKRNQDEAKLSQDWRMKHGGWKR